MHRRLGVLAVACSCKSNNHFSSWLLKLTEHITPLPAGEGQGVGLFIISYTESSEAHRQSSRCLPAEVSSPSA